jgi:hypothetical protein
MAGSVMLMKSEKSEVPMGSWAAARHKCLGNELRYPQKVCLFTMTTMMIGISEIVIGHMVQCLSEAGHWFAIRHLTALVRDREQVVGPKSAAFTGDRWSRSSHCPNLSRPTDVAIQPHHIPQRKRSERSKSCGSITFPEKVDQITPCEE